MTESLKIMFKNKVGGPMSPDPKTYSKAAVIETVTVEEQTKRSKKRTETRNRPTYVYSVAV